MTKMPKTKLRLESLEDREVPATWNYFGSDLGDAADANNWLDGLAPIYGEDVTVPAATGGIDAVSLDGVGALNIEAGWNKTWRTDTLNISNGGDVNDATIDIIGGMVNIWGDTQFGNVFFKADNPAPVTLNGVDTVKTGKSLSSDGTLTNNGTLKLEFNSSVFVYKNSPFNNNGYLDFKDTATIFNLNDSVFTNTEQGHVTVEKGTATFTGFVVTQGKFTLNDGLVERKLVFMGDKVVGTERLSVQGTNASWTLWGGNTIQASKTIHNTGGRWTVMTNIGQPGAAGQTLNILGDTKFNTGTIQIGTSSILGGSPALTKVNQNGICHFTNVILAVTLDWNENTLNSWTARTFQIVGGQVAMATVGEPSPVPANRSWTLLNATVNAINGDFGYYYVGPNYDHEFINTGKTLVIKTNPPPAPPPPPEPPILSM